MINYKTLNPTEKEREALRRDTNIKNAVPTLEKHKNAILKEIDKVKVALRSPATNRSRFTK